MENAIVRKGFLLFIFCSVEDRSNMHYKYNKRKKSIKTIMAKETTTKNTTTNEHLDNGMEYGQGGGLLNCGLWWWLRSIVIY